MINTISITYISPAYGDEVTCTGFEVSEEIWQDAQFLTWDNGWPIYTKRP